MKIAIIGSGLTGLTAAYDLIKQSHQVTIYEANTQLGGLAGGFKDLNWDWYLENYYHHIFTSDLDIIHLAHDLGLADNLIFSYPRTVSPYQNHYFPLDSPQAILRFPGLSLSGKIRLGLVTAYLKYMADWHYLESYTAHEWLGRYYGPEVYQKIWAPLLKGKFGTYAESVNMAWMWSRLKARTTSLGTFEGGFQNFINQFGQILGNRGVTIHTTSAVNAINPQKSGKVKVQIVNENSLFDRVLLTTSPEITLKIASFLPDSYKKKLSSLDSLAALGIIFALNKPLSPEGYYWYNLKKTNSLPFLALVEHTNFVDPVHFGGDYLVYCSDYLDPKERRFRLTKAELVAQCLPVLQSINPQFHPDWIRKTWVHRTPYAQPIPFLNHSLHLPTINTPSPSVFIANMSQVYPWDRGTNYAVELGHRAASIILKS
jgi:protoporphyrinogen oxidase